MRALFVVSNREFCTYLVYILKNLLKNMLEMKIMLKLMLLSLEFFFKSME